MKTQIEIDLTAEELAEIFLNWDNIKQSEFINLIGKQFKTAPFNAELQCCFLVDKINKDGKDFIYTLANFLKVQKIPSESLKHDALLNSYPEGESMSIGSQP